MAKYQNIEKKIQKVMEVVYNLTKPKVFNPLQSINRSEFSDIQFLQA